MTDSTFAAVLDDQLRRGAARPLVTFYDDVTGERVELSVATYANWVAKTAALLQDELDVERGDRLLVDLPTHWLAPVWLGAAWTVGAAVLPAGPGQAARADLVVCGPDGPTEYASTGVPVVASALLPMGARFRDPLPAGVVDYGAVVWGQPDVHVAVDPPGAGDAAWVEDATEVTQGDLLARAAGGELGASGTRLLTDLPPVSIPGIVAFLGPLVAGGGTVWVRHPRSDGWASRADAEQATAVRRTAQPPRS